MKKFSPKTILFIAVLVLLLGFAGYRMWYGGVFVTDRTAQVGTEALFWQGREYLAVSGEYTEGRTVAKSEDGAWSIKEVREDPSRTFVVARAFLTQHLYVRSDYVIPTEGQVNLACWGGKYISDEAFLTAAAQIVSLRTTSFVYETDDLFSLTEEQHMRELYFAYEDCPVPTCFMGYMGTVRGEWVITTANPAASAVGCFRIPEEYIPILEKHLT